MTPLRLMPWLAAVLLLLGACDDALSPVADPLVLDAVEPPSDMVTLMPFDVVPEGGVVPGQPPPRTAVVEDGLIDETGLALNACGGLTDLGVKPGLPCGSCDTGVLACDGTDQVACVGDLGNDAFNTCGGCTTIDTAVAQTCGALDSGLTACVSDDAVECVGALGGLCETDADCASGFCSNATCSPSGFAYAPPATFRMGTDGAALDAAEVDVELTRGFWIARTEFTAGQLAVITGDTATADLEAPAKLNWYAAVVVANRLSEADGLDACYRTADCLVLGEASLPTLCGVVQVRDTCDGYRLPTEAEWEYAATAGGMDDVVNGSAWWAGNADGALHPVGQRMPNAWGLHDTAGNAAEWTFYSRTPRLAATLVDPTGIEDGANRVVRGGDVASDFDALDPRAVDARHPLNDEAGVRFVRELPAE